MGKNFAVAVTYVPVGIFFGSGYGTVFLEKNSYGDGKQGKGFKGGKAFKALAEKSERASDDSFIWEDDGLCAAHRDNDGTF